MLSESAPSTEEWRTIELFPNYAVSDQGRIKRLTTRTCGKAGTILRTPLRGKYPAVDLCRDGSKRTFHVHRLVASAFLPPIQGKPFVNHINGIKTEGWAKNLEYASQGENILHAYRTGLLNAEGENNGASVLNWDKVVRIRVMAHNPKRQSFAKIAMIFGVSEPTIRSVVYGNSWVPKTCLTRLRRNRSKNKPMSFFAIAIRNSKKRGASGYTTVSLLEQKIKYYGAKCRYCGIGLNPGNQSLDHAIPLSRGGTNWTANFIPCCRTCNFSKRHKTIREYMTLRGSGATTCPPLWSGAWPRISSVVLVLTA